MHVAIFLTAIGCQHRDVVATTRQCCRDRAHLRRRATLAEVGIVGLSCFQDAQIQCCRPTLRRTTNRLDLKGANNSVELINRS